MAMLLTERRTARRFLMRLPLTVRWADENMVGEAVAETRDVSARGIRFNLPQHLNSGSAVEILMTIPHELTLAGPVRVRCQGHVLRSFENSGKSEVIATLERFRFIRYPEDTA
jgi:PilZ domain